MEGQELLDYYADMQLFVGLVSNFIDFEDIESPIKAKLQSTGNFRVKPKD